MVKKIVIIGPESTGKSTLCNRLANHFGTHWCPEYAREYLLTHGTAYSFENLLTIARGQIGLEEMFSSKFATRKDAVAGQQMVGSKPDLLFVDTDMQVMKVWCEYVFNDCHTWILNRIAERPYDFYLLCKPDLPWVKDELREYPDEKPRQELFHIYRDILINQHIPWAEVSGSYEERFQKSVATVEAFLKGC